MVDLVPELRLLIGDQPPVPELPPQDAQRRFQLVLRRFLGVFARPEHPLALFLDDLQWLDAATLDLVEHLLTQPDVRHLMLIGAYRDNEVDAAHPLRRKLDAIRQAGALVQEIRLAPLARDDVGQLMAEALRCEPARAAPLAQLVHEKTGGNPFFVMQFISALADEGLLTFDHVHARWSWDLERIHAKGYTENVVDLMVAKLSGLPVETQKALQQLACLGHVADVTLLSIVLGTSEAQVHAHLSEAVRLELVERLAGSYKFVHDRVQEAAYALIPEASRAEAHLRIGRLLAAQTPVEKREEAIFEIVNQLNRGVPLITAQDEREQLAELNLLAGQRAKASTAYASALTYLVDGRALLSDESWERHYELVFGLEFHLAECEFLTGNMAAADDRLSRLAQRARLAEHIVAVVRLRITLYTTLDRSDRAVEVCLEYLERTGTDWSPRPTSQEVQREYDRIWSQLGSRSIEALVDLPLMTDPDALASLDVLTEVVPPALFTDENLVSLVICRMVNLTLEHGNSDGSCFAYVTLGMIAGPRFHNYEVGFRFGRLGYDLVEQRGWHRFQARIYMVFSCLVMPWTRHIRAARDLQRRAFDAANRIGDLTFAAFSCAHLSANLLAAGDPLVEAQREAEQRLEFAQNARIGLVIHVITAQLGLIRTLRGLSPKFGSFDGTLFDELRFERQLSGDPALAQPECLYWIRKLQARFFAQDYPSAIHASARAQRLLWTVPSGFDGAEYHFYSALSHAASCDSTAGEQRQQHVEALVEHHRQLEIWAANCLENFENRAALVGAEIARIDGREREAMDLYEQAIRSARANGFVHHEALAHELAARFYAARGFEQIAQLYLRNARHGYLRWGADGKVRQLEALYPHLREAAPVPGATSTIGAPVEHLDLATVLKVSQAVSGEIVLEKLLETLMRMAIEHAGAERGLLILLRGEALRIEAEATTSGDTIVVHLRDEPIDGGVLPESIISYVVRTQESVILDDASARHPFAADAYVRERHAHSVLCVPLLKQAELIGVLYLENNLAPHVFTPSRLTVLKLLASQAAVALENARLAAERQAHLWFLESLERVNRAMQGTNDLEQMMGDVLDAVLSIFHCDRAWLTYPCDPDTAWWRVVMERTRAEFPGASAWGRAAPCADTVAPQDLPMEPQFTEVFRAVRAVDGPVQWGPGGQPVSGPTAERFRVQSLLAMALYPKVDRPYMFGLHQCAYPRVWTPQEERLFQEIGQRLADALTGLLMFRSLRESERRLDEAQRIAHVGYWDRDLDTGRITLSDEACRIFGLQPEERVVDLTQWHERWLVLIHTEDRPRIAAAAATALRGGPPYDVEYRVVRPDGEVRIIYSRGEVTWDEAGRPRRMFGMMQDITELRRAEDELRASEARFRTFVDHATDAFFLHDEHLTVLDVNRQACESLGYSREELIGMHPRDFDVDLDEAAMERLAQRVGAGETVTFETRHRRKDGTVFEVEIRTHQFQQGQQSLRYALVRDITERKRAEQRLVAQHSVTRILAEVATVEEATPQILQALCECLGWDLGTLWRLDREAGVLRCAQMWRQPSVEATHFEAATRASTFRPGSGLPGQVWASRAPACIPDVAHDPGFLRARIAAREGLHAAFAFPILLGSEVLGVIDVVSREIRQPDQDLLDMMASVGSQIGQFIERKRAEESLRQAQAELAHVARLTTLGELTASIAHEINQPLGAMVNSANACVRWLAAQNLERAQQSAVRIVADGQRAGAIITRIRALAKNAPSRKDWLDLNDTIRDVLALAHSEVQRHRVVVETHLAEPVPLVLGRPHPIAASPAQSTDQRHRSHEWRRRRAARVVVQSDPDAAPGVRVTVRDSGPGLDPQRLDRLFDAFYTTKPHGLGLGLAISRRIIEAHGGRLWATANTPHGAVFQFTVPTGERGGSMTDAEALVFVVDDDASLRASLQDLLESVGLRVAACASAQDFLRHPRPEGPSCLVLDVRLPGLSGLELQQRLATGDLAMPIIFITGHGDIPMSVQAMKAGAVDFLPKPFRDQDLLDAIHQALARARHARAQRAEMRRPAPPVCHAHAAAAGRDGAYGGRAAQQADRGRAGHERGHGENAPPAGDGQDARRVPRRPRQNR